MGKQIILKENSIIILATSMIAKEYRLATREVKKALRIGKPFFSHNIVANSYCNTCEYNRFAIVIGGKSVHNAVERNFFRRTFYHLVSPYVKNVPIQGNDLVFVIKKQTKLAAKDEKNVANFKKDIDFLLRKVFSSKKILQGKK